MSISTTLDELSVSALSRRLFSPFVLLKFFPVYIPDFLFQLSVFWEQWFSIVLYMVRTLAPSRISGTNRKYSKGFRTVDPIYLMSFIRQGSDKNEFFHSIVYRMVKLKFSRNQFRSFLYLKMNFIDQYRFFKYNVY